MRLLRVSGMLFVSGYSLFTIAHHPAMSFMAYPGVQTQRTLRWRSQLSTLMMGAARLVTHAAWWV